MRRLLVAFCLACWAYPFQTFAQTVLKLGTETAASGTAVDFPNIPPWVTRITIMFDSVSTKGSSPMIVRIGDAGGIATSGYASSATELDPTPTAVDDNASFILEPGSSTAFSRSGSVVLTRMNTNNKWTSVGTLRTGSQSSTLHSAGVKTLGATLDRVRITMSNGKDTFDAGNFNIIYE